LDLHQGNGLERDFIDDEVTFIMDMSNELIYPGDRYAKKGIKKEVKMGNDSEDAVYTAKLEQTLTECIDGFRPDIVLYNAGTDCMVGDPLGNMDLSPEGIKQRDLIVFRICIKRNIPIVMVLSGGYQKSNAPVIADSIIQLEQQLQLLSLAKKKLLCI